MTRRFAIALGIFLLVAVFLGWELWYTRFPVPASIQGGSHCPVGTTLVYSGAPCRVVQTSLLCPPVARTAHCVSYIQVALDELKKN